VGWPKGGSGGGRNINPWSEGKTGINRPKKKGKKSRPMKGAFGPEKKVRSNSKGQYKKKKLGETLFKMTMEAGWKATSGKGKEKR